MSEKCRRRHRPAGATGKRGKTAPQSIAITNPSLLMTHSIKHSILLLLAVAFLALISTGCNTAHGFGKDVEKAGDKIQDGTD